MFDYIYAIISVKMNIPSQREERKKKSKKHVTAFVLVIMVYKTFSSDKGGNRLYNPILLMFEVKSARFTLWEKRFSSHSNNGLPGAMEKVKKKEEQLRIDTEISWEKRLKDG